MKGKKKRNYTMPLIVVLAIIFAVILGIFDKPVNAVKGFECERVCENGITLKWKADSKADGYIIYQKDASTGDLKELVKYEKNDVTGYFVKPLDQATKYSFAIKSFKMHGDKIKESDKASELTAFTCPSAVEVKSVMYIEKGLAEVSWEKNDKAAGYEVQYSKNEDFGNSDEIKAESGETIVTVKDLDKESGYYFRVRSFISDEDEKIYSEWSAVSEIISYEEFEKAPKVDPNKPMIALTFDDGPGYNGASDRIVDVLEKYNARATFFMVGTNAADHPKNIKRKADLGCELGNHTHTHGHYGSQVTASDIKNCSDAIYNICGKRPTCFRSPGGNTTQAIRNECITENMPLYYWSVDTNDWKYRDANKVYNHVMNYAKDGDIVLMHEIYDSTASAVEKMVPELIAQGYQLVTVSELVQAKTGSAPVAGKEYITSTSFRSE